jgi:hypothetical protein
MSSYSTASIFIHLKLRYEVCILSCLLIVLRLKAGCTMILIVSLQFAKHVFGVRPFSNLQNNTTQIIIAVIKDSFTPVLCVQVAIFL